MRMDQTKYWLLAASVAVAIAWVLPPFIGRYYTQMLALGGIYAIVAQGLNLLAGYTGQTSLGHAGFYAIGAYTGALLATKMGLGFWSAMPFSILMAAAAGVLIALPSFKLDGPYLAMVTIAFGIIVNSVVVEWSDLTGGTQGVLNIPRPSLFGSRLQLESQFVVIVAAVAVVTLLIRNLMRSPCGRAFVAVKDNPVAAQAVGLNTQQVKTLAFTISAALAGLGGHFFAFVQGFISPEAFEFEASIFFLTAMIFGGAGTIVGPAIGAAIMTFLPELLQRFVDYRLIIYGTLIVTFLYFLPLGIVGTLLKRSTRLPDLLTAPGSRRGAQIASPHPAFSNERRAGGGDAIVRLTGVRMVFGGVRALNGVDLEIRPGVIHALIGPNGAGKTVLINVLTGYYRPTAGSVVVAGEDVTGAPPHRLARLGIARTFQTAQLFAGLTVLQNVLIGFPYQTRGRLFDCALITPRLRREEAHRRSRALELLDFVGFKGNVESLASSLPFGHQRLVEIARALATGPSLIAMDEPAAGLNPKEVQDLDGLITRIRATGVAILLVEHHMDLVMGISDTVTVLDHGEKLAEGTAVAMQNDPEVIKAYLGADIDEVSAA